MNPSFFWSRSFLLNRTFLWLLFIVNFAGTIYGYMWYESQLVWTVANKPGWMIPFVPDSPTSSLFFSAAVLYLLFPLKKPSKIAENARVIIEALAVVCSVKYGIWAVAMIVIGAAQGDVLNWTHYMLIISHLGMAFEALLYFRFMKAGTAALTVALTVLIINDTVDYTFDVYPGLSSELEDDITPIKWFTYNLSLLSFAAAFIVMRFRNKKDDISNNGISTNLPS
ncbi:DUF1405 domain-containing protein [Paenibacillus sp. GSMTC-2017]|uniref:DUF1405 domain-containing protein n=1 Tax=Paenibacillus sp. GSMTC-2017 TaxID=2794350 RepID=UPI0018DA1C85|nr:DUF1405 domain-containing protein [Paenibacillus sp. GSMTC-2017]MBH5317932.1 DUF1405 domain-containing protein [Paenibacillus sp. GSMTC-2017]